MKEQIIINALIRILKNQVTIKEHMGLIKTRDKYVDDEYYSDAIAIEDLECCIYEN